MSTTAASKSQSSHFDQAAADWDQRPTSQQLMVVPSRLMAEVAFGIDDRVLDLGAGTGLLATAIASKVTQVTAIDMSEPMLAVLDAKGHANIRTVLGNVAQYSKEHLGQYSAIVSCMVLHHIPDTAETFRALADLLQPGGRIALVDLFAEDGTFHGTPEENAEKGVQHHGFDPEALRALAAEVGLVDIKFQPIAEVQQRNGRAYPLFLMTGHLR
ncbi:methyltransferase domain-containing protein [Diaphorobacter sp. HDW4A]|uniref:class I SAM-dependent methyltransferase n=1 Tax=Diaphorobacter sp. HDW4A TaxID=2714924 RepID=UPI00140D283A|nr:methyltransferase domain-containing protein [Diaphorobacter sp. HDW4A]QIL78535.1 methyltransferase domain-containing protein [Diaphorobacter sp. HDW4A]